MRKLFGALLALALASSIAQAQRAPDPAPAQRHELAETADQQPATHPAPDEGQLVSHRHYKARTKTSFTRHRGRRATWRPRAPARSVAMVWGALARAAAGHARIIVA